MITRPAIFKWRQTEPGIILCAVRWYLRYALSLRDVEELLEERDLNVGSHNGLAVGAGLRP
jgi:transposase-like protein